MRGVYNQVGDPEMKVLAALAVLATAGMTTTIAYAQTSGMERRDDRREDREAGREEKAECKAGDEESRPECRQEKRETKREGEGDEGAKEPTNEGATDQSEGDQEKPEGA
jgi:hypothetical protein